MNLKINKKLEDYFEHNVVNTTTLHPLNIERLNKLFAQLIKDGYNYEIDDIADWLNTYHSNWRAGGMILEIAAAAKKGRDFTS